MGHLAVVIRKSTKDDAKVSLNRQEAMGREWAAQRELEVVVYGDDAVSGVRMDRPGWVAFANAVKAGQVHTVWAYEQSRLTRAGQVAWDGVCALLTAAGIREVHTHRQGTVSVVEGDRLHGSINSVMDQHEREVAKVRTLDGIDRMAREGRPPASTGYGYQRSYDDLEGRPVLTPDPEQAAVVGWMVEKVADGWSLGAVAADLNARAVPTPSGGKTWGRDSVRTIVTAPRIVGQRVHQGRIIGEARWPAIVDRDLWDRAQHRLAQNRPGRVASDRRTYLLTGGLAVCERCRTALIAGTTAVKGVRLPSYQCPHPSRSEGGCGKCSILAGRLEQRVSEAVSGILHHPALVDELNRYLADGYDVAPLKAEIADLEDQLVELAEQLGSGDLLPLEHAAARRGLVARRDAAMGELHRIPAPALVTAAGLVDAWEAAADDVPTRRSVLEAVVRPIIVSGAFRDGRRLTVDQRVKVTPLWLPA